MSDIPDGYYQYYVGIDYLPPEPVRVKSIAGMSARRRRRVVAVLLKRDGGKCHYCGVEMTPNGGERIDTTMTREHVLPRCFGGTNEQTNLVLACNQCNNDRGDTIDWCFCDFCTAALKDFKEHWSLDKKEEI